jgi:exodeoxyribonuclease VII large subunit
MSAALSFIKASNLRAQGLESKLQLLNPENVLQRGYSITSLNGRIVKDIGQVKHGDLIHTQLSEGTLSSRIIDKKN